MPWHGPDGQRLYYEYSGRGDTVVLMPGWAGNIIELSPLRTALSAGFRVLAADLPGSGRSEPQPRRYDAGYYREDARALLGLLDALGISAAHLAGFSDGGEVAVLMAGLRPGLALSVFTWGAAGKIEATPAELTSIENAVDQPADGMAALAAYLATAYGPGAARLMTRSWAQAMRDIVAAGGDISRSSAHLITCPALIVAGTYDPHCPPSLASELAALIPKGRFLEAPGAGHEVHLSHGAWLAGQLTRWLGSH
ncbi:MAG TPA: alpha/beta hydrolase [Streptosporangiaceae bacterium]|nr:alpha/beta hydrolase [Streptosporangiaceae bacterium]